MLPLHVYMCIYMKEQRCARSTHVRDRHERERTRQARPRHVRRCVRLCARLCAVNTYTRGSAGHSACGYLRSYLNTCARGFKQSSMRSDQVRVLVCCIAKANKLTKSYEGRLSLPNRENLNKTGANHVRCRYTTWCPTLLFPK